MNRNEKREQERKIKNLQSWLKSFNVDQKRLWEQTVVSEVEKNDKTTTLILDTCYMAAISSVVDLELIDIERIVTESSTYIQDYKNKLEKGDVLEMLKSEERKVQLSIKVYIKRGIDKVEAIKELEKEYKLPFAELDVMWLQVKSKMGIVNKHTPKPKNAAEEEVKEVLEETKEIPYAVTEKEIEEAREKEATIIITPTGIKCNAPIKASKLKIIEQTIKVQGKYGTYIKGIDGVETESQHFKDVDDLEDYKKGVEEEYSENMQEIEEQLKIWNDKKENIEIGKKKRLDKIEEIKAVFNMKEV